MATVGSFDFNKTPVSNTVNNVMELGAEITEGLATEAPGIGEAIGIFITLVIYVILIILILGIIFIILKWVRSLISNFKGLGKEGTSGGF